MNKVHLIMPMGGAGTRFFNNGFDMPKPLITLHNKPFFYWAAQSLLRSMDVESLIFVVLQEHIDNFKIDAIIRSYYPQAKIAVIPHVLKGAVLTCMEGVKLVKDNSPVIFNDCDHMFTCWEFHDFCAGGDFKRPDGALLTFTSDDPKFSFAQLNDDGTVSRTVEKRAISRDAICGAYYFRNRHVFEDAGEIYLKNCNYNEFFVSGVYNVMCEQGQEVRVFRVDRHIPFGTPDEFEAAVQAKSVFEELKN